MLLQKASFRSTLDSTSLSTFVLLLRSYSRITATEEEEWLDNVAEFVAAGDDDELGALSSSLRSRCADVLGETMSVKPAELLTALSVACSVAHQQGQDKRAQAQTGWWKEEEASLSFVGGQAENVMEKLDEETQATKSFDIESLFSMSVMPYMDPSTPAFLYGRCFVFASQFSPILPTHLANAFLDAAVMAMEDSSNVGREGDDIVKLSAVRCVKNFHRNLDESVVQPYAARILGRLAPLLDNDNEDLIVLITETLQAVSGFCNATVSLSRSLCDPHTRAIQPRVMRANCSSAWLACLHTITVACDRPAWVNEPLGTNLPYLSTHGVYSNIIQWLFVLWSI